MVDADARLRRETGRADVPGTTAESPDGSKSDRRLRGVARLFSVRSFAIAGILGAGGWLVVGGLLPLGIVGNLLGVLLAAFAFGLLASARRYLEVAAAGFLVGVVAGTITNPVLLLIGVGVPIVVLAATGGALAGVLGYYFGRDLRAGLTREL